MKEIPLHNGMVAMVDDEDYPGLMEYRWYAVRMGNHTYAMRKAGRNKTVLMHRQVMGAGPNDPDIDHADMNGLNNQKENLRFATKSENGANREKQRNNTSGYKDVSTAGDKWRAYCRVHGHQHQLGRWSTRELAAATVNVALDYFFGQFARLNEIPEGIVVGFQIPLFTWHQA